MIIGPIGIVIADSLLGEVTPQMAVAIGQANAVKILLPVNKCDNLVAGVADLSITTLIEDVIKKIKEIISCCDIILIILNLTMKSSSAK